MSVELARVPEAGDLVFAKALIWIPDGRCAFQRRPGDEDYGPNELGFFGGQVEPSDATPLDGLRRELVEETDMPPAVVASMQFIEVVPPIMVEGREGLLTHRLFLTATTKVFGAREGHVELHKLDEALGARPTPVARYILQSLTTNRGPAWR